MFKKILATLSCGLLLSGTFVLSASALQVKDTITVDKSASSNYQYAKSSGSHTYRAENQPMNGDRVQLVSGGWIYNAYFDEQGVPNKGNTVSWRSQYGGAHFLKWTSTGKSTLEYTWTMP